jgi:hypothetical protein
MTSPMSLQRAVRLAMARRDAGTDVRRRPIGARRPGRAPVVPRPGAQQQRQLALSFLSRPAAEGERGREHRLREQEPWATAID